MQYGKVLNHIYPVFADICKIRHGTFGSHHLSKIFPEKPASIKPKDLAQDKNNEGLSFQFP